MSGLVPVRTVGSTTSFLRRPPQSRRAPAWTASSIQVDGADSVAFANERADIGGFVERVAGLELLDAFDQQISEFSVNRLLDENALNRNAGLTGISETSGDAAVGGVGEVGVAVNDDRRVAAEFEDDFLFSCATLDVPTNGNAAGETDELDAVVGDEQSGVFIGKRKDVEAAIRPSRLLDALRQKQRAERRLRRGLQAPWDIRRRWRERLCARRD